MCERINLVYFEKTIKTIRIISMILAVFAGLFFWLINSVSYKVNINNEKIEWEKIEMKGIVTKKNVHISASEKPTIEISCIGKTIKINKWGQDDTFASIIVVGDSVSKDSGEYEIDVFRDKKFLKKCFPYKE